MTEFADMLKTLDDVLEDDGTLSDSIKNAAKDGAKESAIDAVQELNLIKDSTESGESGESALKISINKGEGTLSVGDVTLPSDSPPKMVKAFILGLGNDVQGAKFLDYIGDKPGEFDEYLKKVAGNGEDSAAENLVEVLKDNVKKFKIGDGEGTIGQMMAEMIPEAENFGRIGTWMEETTDNIRNFIDNLKKSLKKAGKSDEQINEMLNGLKKISERLETGKTLSEDEIEDAFKEVFGENFEKFVPQYKELLEGLPPESIEMVNNIVKKIIDMGDGGPDALEKMTTWGAVKSWFTSDTILGICGGIWDGMGWVVTKLGDLVKGILKFCFGGVGGLIACTVAGLIAWAVVLLIHFLNRMSECASGCWLISNTKNDAYKVEFLTCAADWMRISNYSSIFDPGYPTINGKAYTPNWFSTLIADKSLCDLDDANFEQLKNDSVPSNTCGIINTCGSGDYCSTGNVTDKNCVITTPYDNNIKPTGTSTINCNQSLYSDNDNLLPTDSDVKNSYLGPFGGVYGNAFNSNWRTTSTQPVIDSGSITGKYKDENASSYIGPCIRRDPETGYCSKFYKDIEPGGDSGNTSWSITTKTPWCPSNSFPGVTNNQTVCEFGMSTKFGNSTTGNMTNQPIWVPNGYTLVFNHSNNTEAFSNLFSNGFHNIANDMNPANAFKHGAHSIWQWIVLVICIIIFSWLFVTFFVPLMKKAKSEFEDKNKGSGDTSNRKFALDYKLLSKYD